MKKTRNTIKKSILLSHISVIIIFTLLTAIVFNIFLNIYIKRQAKSQLVTAAGLVHKSISSYLPNLNIKQDIRKQDKEIVKILLKVKKTLKQTELFLDINYAIIEKEKNLLYPKVDSSDDLILLEQEILPALGKIRNITIDKSNRILYFKANGKKYVSILYPLKLKDSKSLGYLFLYSDLSKANRLSLAVNIILLSILLITAIIGLMISNIISKKISYPITQLSIFAQQIGEREYPSTAIKFEENEIGQLAETMKIMADKLSAYDNTIKTFLQNASHELRTPLMSIQGYAEGIKYGVVDNQNNAVEIIIEESKRLSKLVEDLLYLSKIDAMQETMNLEKINAEDLIRSCINRVRGIAVNYNKTIVFSSNDKNISLIADEEKLSRAIINVLGNCLRYSESRVEVILEKNNQEVNILIKDDGCGFQDENLNHIFERFYKGKGGNYGLGLAIAKTIIEKHHGGITASNNVEGGACFKILFH